MRLSKLFQKTSKNVSKSEVSRNAQLLTQAGYIDQLMSGVYSYLPLGLKVLNKIENIIREEMENIDSQEILMPALHPGENWKQTGRWDTVDVLFKLKGSGDRDLALGATHEEVVAPLSANIIKSYKDLPASVYQVQTKFRNEARAKSGLLRGREFRMKDMYSFHATQKCLDEYYEQATAAYNRIYERCGLGGITLVTFASGGAFSKYSHEFQTVTEYGEDVIYRIPGTNQAINKEIISDYEVLKEIVPNYKKGDEDKFEELKAIEVGNIFKLGTKFSKAFKSVYTDETGEQKLTIMGCYGIGPSRVMGTIAECLSDDNGLVWPEEVAPFKVHLICLSVDPEHIDQCDDLYESMKKAGIEVLYDDRANIRAGAKLADSDLLGIPNRLVLSKKTLGENAVEFKRRNSEKSELLPIGSICNKFK